MGENADIVRRAFDAFSRKSGKYDVDETRARWGRLAASPPRWIGIGTLIYEARKADPCFPKHKPASDPGNEPEQEDATAAPEDDRVQINLQRTDTLRSEGPLRAAMIWKGIGAGERYAPEFAEVFPAAFRDIAVQPSWLTSDVLALARGIYDERAFGRMPILADALQDAGCDRDDILSHCRATHWEHVRGCWVIDLLLGRPWREPQPTGQG